MSELFHIHATSPQRAELMEYCKMENVPLAILLCFNKPENTMKLKLKSIAFHLLQRVDKRLNIMLDRLSADVEHNRMVQRRL